MYYFIGVWLLSRAVLVSAASSSDRHTWPHCLRENGQPTRGPYQTSHSPDSGLTLSPWPALDAPRLQAPPAPASSLSLPRTLPTCSLFPPEKSVSVLEDRSQTVLSARLAGGPHHRRGGLFNSLPGCSQASDLALC